MFDIFYRHIKRRGDKRLYISYDYYRIFYFVAKCGSVSQAAKMLLNNQPNLTRTIKNLESELGCPLFSRTNRGMKLTPEGEKLYSHIKIALKHIEAGEDEITDVKNLQSGTVTVAASEVAFKCVLLPVIKKFRELYPGIKIKISDHSTPQAISALKERMADLAVVTTPTVRTPSLTQIGIKSVREVAVCPESFTEFKDKTVQLNELSGRPLVALGSDTKSYEFYSNFFASNGLAYQPDIEAFSADQILPMVKAGLGVGFVPEEFLNGVTGVNVIKLKEQIPERKICIIKRKEQPLSVAAGKLEEMLLGEK